MKIVPISVKLVHATPYPAHVIEAMGRICYQSEPKAPCPECKGDHPFSMVLQYCACCGDYHTDPKGAEAFVRMLIKKGHESVLEHVSAGFRIVTDRGVTHELVRHRLASFSQESTRYCDYAGDRLGGELSFIEPPCIKLEPDTSCYIAWLDSLNKAEVSYQDLRAHDIPPEIARSVLPNALKSELGMTCNAREWRHVLRLRLSPKAHPQMRQVMRLVAKELLAWCPALFEDVVPQETP